MKIMIHVAGRAPVTADVGSILSGPGGWVSVAGRDDAGQLVHVEIDGVDRAGRTFADVMADPIDDEDEPADGGSTG